MSYSEGLRDFAESAKDLRWKICNYSYDFYLRTGRLTWSFDQEIGSPVEWKRKMSQDGCWGDEIFLVKTQRKRTRTGSGERREM